MEIWERNAVLEEAASLADSVSIELAANGSVCQCRNGRVPITAYREAVLAFASSIRKLKTEQQET